MQNGHGEGVVNVFPTTLPTFLQIWDDITVFEQ